MTEKKQRDKTRKQKSKAIRAEHRQAKQDARQERNDAVLSLYGDERMSAMIRAII